MTVCVVVACEEALLDPLFVPLFVSRCTVVIPAPTTRRAVLSGSRTINCWAWLMTESGISSAVGPLYVYSVRPVVVGTIASMSSSGVPLRSTVRQLTRTEISSFTWDSMCTPFVPVAANLVWTPDGTVLSVWQPRPSFTVRIRRFDVVLPPLCPTLIMCRIDALGYCASRWPSFWTQRRITRLWLATTIRFSHGTLEVVALLRRSTPLNSFNMLVNTALQFTVSRVAQDGLMPRDATAHVTVRHRYGTPGTWPFRI